MTLLSKADRALVDKAKAILARNRKEAKAARPKPVRPTAKGQRNVRERDPLFLAYLRRQPCEAAHLGDCYGPVQSAHIRTSIPGRPNPGMQRKADDQFATPLCTHHHIYVQHSMNEREFWKLVGKDPFEVAAQHYAAFKGDR